MVNLINKLLGNSKEKKVNKLNAWMLDLEDLDDINALKLSTQKLAQSIDQDSLSIEQKLDLIIELEALNQVRLEKLSLQFANLKKLKPELEANIYDTCYGYHRQSYIYHLKVLEKIINPSGFKMVGNIIILVIARAVYAAFNMCKWRLFAQQNPPTKVWLQIFTLYKIADKQNLLQTSIELFSNSPSTTLSASFVQISMLGQLTQASMEKNELEIAAKVIQTWLTRAKINDKDGFQENQFFINLAQDYPAKRMRNFEPNKECRYWELDGFEKQLTIAITTSVRGELPNNLTILKIDNIKILNDTLNILHSEWRKDGYIRQRRKENREAASKTAKVKAGIYEICDQVLQANQVNKGIKLTKGGKTLEQLLDGHSTLIQASSLSIDSSSLDTWVITDLSNNGFGVRANKYANIRARKDKLIGLVIDGDPGETIIGTVRGVKSTHKNQLKIGIEIISRQAVWVQLQAEQQNYASTEGENDLSLAVKTQQDLFPGIYLASEKGISEKATLILPKISFISNAKYTVYVNGKAKRIRLTTPIHSQDDWVQVLSPL